MPAPVVGVTTYLDDAVWARWHKRAALVAEDYLAIVEDAGGLPLLVAPIVGGPVGDPGRDAAHAADLLSRLDALILVGGADVDPVRYGAARHDRTGPADPARDASELALVREAWDADLPILGICRGHQILNVALGGTLHQHVPDLAGTNAHQPGDAFGRSAVEVTHGSLVARAIGTAVEVSCRHHQSVDRPGEGLQVVARSADGVVEAVEAPASAGKRFVVGVQWHPEEDRDSTLVRAMLEAAGTPRGHALAAEIL